METILMTITCIINYLLMGFGAFVIAYFGASLFYSFTVFEKRLKTTFIPSFVIILVFTISVYLNAKTISNSLLVLYQTSTILICGFTGMTYSITLDQDIIVERLSPGTETYRKENMYLGSMIIRRITLLVSVCFMASALVKYLC